MSDELNKIMLQAQKYIENIPVIVLGSGASVSYGLPTMWTLSEYLKNNIKVESNEEWDKFVHLLDNNIDLETALQKVNLDEMITNEIITKTWQLIN